MTTCSPARLLANQANAQRSTGPRTVEGKARSRGNALKHGLTGQGIALPDEDAAEVARRFSEFQADLNPANAMGEMLVRRIALLSVRLERCAGQESASLSKNIRHAKDDHDDQRQAEVTALLEGLADDPANNSRRLLRTPEGVDAMIFAWLDLKADLGHSNLRRWTAAHCQQANNLIGRRMDEVTNSRINELSNAIWGDFRLLDDHEGEGLDHAERQSWARDRLVEFIDGEVETLRAYREMLDQQAFDKDREEAGQRALFDPSKEAILARRYEAAAERGLFRSLREFRLVQREAASNPQPARTPDPSPLGSFFPEPEPSIDEDDETLADPESRPVQARDRGPNARIRPISAIQATSRPDAPLECGSLLPLEEAARRRERAHAPQSGLQTPSL